MYVAVVAVVVALHFGFIGYLLGGGFLAWRHPRTIWLHIATAAWAVAITVVPSLECPLTLVERWARGHGGMDPLPSDGFIAHYVTGVFYPTGAADIAQLAAMLVVAASWAGFVLLHAPRSSGRLAVLLPILLLSRRAHPVRGGSASGPTAIGSDAPASGPAASGAQGPGPAARGSDPLPPPEE